MISLTPGLRRRKHKHTGRERNCSRTWSTSHDYWSAESTHKIWGKKKEKSKREQMTSQRDPRRVSCCNEIERFRIYETRVCHPSTSKQSRKSVFGCREAIQKRSDIERPAANARTRERVLTLSSKTQDPAAPKDHSTQTRRGERTGIVLSGVRNRLEEKTRTGSTEQRGHGKGSRRDQSCRVGLRLH